MLFNQNMPLEPWSDVVIYEIIATYAHRNMGDNDDCMVVVMSDYRGVDLVI